MGFDSAKFVTSVADDKKCLLCHGALDNPVRSACGHVFCSGCILPFGCQTRPVSTKVPAPRPDRP
ncbi:unnamed protein product [Lymnaea stagnalis]|uniref:RING-type domain-containing protein n=1 Tax=Lymnaea stagnalis TaxID=6523 RepID=A0AAV2IGZ5_LYMST